MSVGREGAGAAGEFRSSGSGREGQDLGHIMPLCELSGVMFWGARPCSHTSMAGVQSIGCVRQDCSSWPRARLHQGDAQAAAPGRADLMFKEIKESNSHGLTAQFHTGCH